MKTQEKKVLSDINRAEIKAYLDDSENDFAVGFALMQKFSVKISIMHMIGRRSSSPLMKQKLDYELEKIAQQDFIGISPYADKAVMNKVHPDMANILKEHAISVETKIIESLPKEINEEVEKSINTRFKIGTGDDECVFETLPAEIQKQFNNARRFYQLERHFHTVVKLAKTNDERSAALKLCKDYEDLSKGAWTILDKWKADGKPLPEQDAPKSDLPADIARSIGSAESYLSRYSGGLETKQGKKYEHLKEMLIKKISILNENKIPIPSRPLEILQKHSLVS